MRVTAPEPRARRSLDPGMFRRAMGSFATGVTVITTFDGDEVHGMTANAFMSGSMSPPLCLVSVAKRAHTHALIVETGRFGVTVLAAHQEPLARRFAGQAGAVDDVAFEELGGAPVLCEGVARIATKLHAAVDCGDHTLCVGEIVDVLVGDQAPLVYHRSAFRALRQDRAKHAPAPEFW
jgi:flavin reductase (DIM6/NTAB) family NADH-FMN oxidoreductase RutF